MDPASRAMDVEKSSLCNCVVNFLLQENYLLTAFELLHELVEDGRDDQAIRLREFFSDASRFPPDRISRLNTLRVADPQSLLEDNESLEKKLAISDYELRLSREDLSRLQLELQKALEDTHDVSTGISADIHVNADIAEQQEKKESSFSLGPLKDAERRDLNCAVKEYLLLAGYKLTAMTFYEEVTDQNLDVLPKSPACASDALRHYYYQYLSCTDEAAEEKMSLIHERESLLKENEQLTAVVRSLQNSKDLSDGKLTVLTKSLEATQKDLKDRDALMHNLKQTVELQRRELNDCRKEITSLKMHIESSQASRKLISGIEQALTLHVDDGKGENLSLQTEVESLKEKDDTAGKPMISAISLNEEESGEHEIGTSVLHSINSVSDALDAAEGTCDESKGMLENPTIKSMRDSLNGNPVAGSNGLSNDKEHQPLMNDGILVQSPLNPKGLIVSDKVGFATINTLSEALPKIVPNVLINAREELLPLMMCAIEHHPDCDVRDSLTHTLFNLIKRPDEQQRRIIMAACVNLAKNVGEMRTETELLPQCWEQINHTSEERRLLVAQSCGELAEFVRPEIRDSLILSIVQQLVEDSATVVREAAARNLALLLPLFPTLDKYFKVEELLFQLVCDPSGLVVETTLKELMPAVLMWGNKLEHILRVLRSHILGSAQRCPPASGVEGSVDSYLRVLGERERWNIDVLLHMLNQLLPFVYQKAIDSCPFTSSAPIIMTPSSSVQTNSFFSISLLELYSVGNIEWSAFDWMHVDCFPDLIQLSCLLPTKEDNLRDQITKFLLDVSASYGDSYLTHIMLPIFLLAAGDDADLSFIPTASQSRIKGLRPKTAMAERLAKMCVLPLLLVGVLGAPSKQEQLADYLRKLLFQRMMKETSWSVYKMNDLIDAVRFLCSHQEHHATMFNILWEMVVSSELDQKIFAANLMKVLVSYIDVKVASTHILPALVTLGSDQNLSVKYASIDAFGSVAQHVKDDMIIDKIRVQMDAFLEDGSHEATVAVIRALSVAVPHTLDRLRDYLLSKIFQLTSLPAHGNDVTHHRERTNAFCEAIRALDATDLPATSVRDYLLPSIQNLLKEADALDPAHKEALEVIAKERSGGTLEAISKAVGSHLSIASSVTSFFGESARHTPEAVLPPQPTSPAQQEDNRFRRMIRGNFSDMFKRQTEEQ